MGVAGFRESLRSASVVFWDFDGVIKESVTVKSVAFERLFLPYGRELATRVRQHHEVHGGVSRFEKMPIYLGWAGEPATPEQIQRFCDRFAQGVRQAVIDAPWVPGVREYLAGNDRQQRFVLVTATPQEEMQQILSALGIIHHFREVHGSPTTKAAAVRDVLQRWQCPADKALVVGDSETDLEAAAASGVPFLLRRTDLNGPLQDRHSGPSFESLNHE